MTMLPTCSKRPLTGRKVLSATALTIYSSTTARSPRTRSVDNCIPSMGAPPGATVGWTASAPTPDRQRGWYVPRAVGESATGSATPWSHRPARALLAPLALLVMAGGISACGGGQRQDVPEPVGNSPVEVPKASFPAHQQLSETTDLQLAIKNPGDKPLPDLAITIYPGTGPPPTADG